MAVPSPDGGAQVMVIPVAAISVAWLASALAFAIATAGTPGPNNAMLTSSGSLWGFRRAIPHMLGVSIGFPLMLIAVAAGAGDLLVNHPAALTVLRWLGAAYLLYLAWKIATARPDAAGDRAGGSGVDGTGGGVDRGGRTQEDGRPLSFVQAALFQWVNVKAWLITISALATLTSVAHPPSFVRALILAGVFLTVTFPVTAFWTSLGVGRACRASAVLNDRDRSVHGSVRPAKRSSATWDTTASSTCSYRLLSDSRNGAVQTPEMLNTTPNEIRRQLD